MRFELQFKGQTALQVYDGVNGWTGMMLNDLIRIELRPATGSPIEWVETSK